MHSTVFLYTLLVLTTAERLVDSSSTTTNSLPVHQKDPINNCTEQWFSQRVDHFRATVPIGGNVTWSQRYYVCSTDTFDPSNGAIFFYTGNEGDVTLYINHTGIMWENAASFNALLVFAEHRYYGASLPFGADTFNHMEYLSSAQALADYVVLLDFVKETYAGTESNYVPVISFGGSYGGVLSAMIRAKYPGSIDGAIAASAPLRAFPGQTWNSSSYYSVITRDASTAGGSTDVCSTNIRNLWSVFFADIQTVEGRARLSTSFQTCAPLNTTDDGLALAFWIRGNWDSMSMGNYPYPSSYITGGSVTLPPFPVRVACGFLSTPIDPVNNTTGLYNAVAQAVAVVGNATPVSCNDIDPNPYTSPASNMDGIWDYQRCNELQPDSFWFSTYGSDSDMFWYQPENISFTLTHCMDEYNVVPPLTWMTQAFNLPIFHGGTSRIIFSNGEYDPWGAAGIQISPNPEIDLVSVFVPEGAHHLDLMFSNPMDPIQVTNVRTYEMQMVRAWVTEARNERQQRYRKTKASKEL